MKKIYFSSALFLAFFSSFSQDPQFLNTTQSLLYLNPSFAGSNGGVRNQFSYRNQWPELGNYITTYFNTADVYLKPLKAGIGVSILSDNLMNGTLKTNVLSLSYAQYFSTKGGDLKIIPSIQASYGKRNLDLQNMTFGEAIDPRYGSVWSSNAFVPLSQKQYLDFSGGILFNYKNRLFLGGSVFHVNQPDVGLLGAVKMPRTVNIHASYNFVFTKWSNAHVFYRYQNQNKYNSHQIGINLISFKHLITGVACTNFDLPQFNLGYRNNYFTLVGGYDLNISRLSGNSAGSFEVHASFNLRNKEQRKQLTSYESW